MLLVSASEFAVRAARVVARSDLTGTFGQSRLGQASELDRRYVGRCRRWDDGADRGG
jgi:hypothetical protein